MTGVVGGEEISTIRAAISYRILLIHRYVVSICSVEDDTEDEIASILKKVGKIRTKIYGESEIDEMERYRQEKRSYDWYNYDAFWY